MQKLSKCRLPTTDPTPLGCIHVKSNSAPKPGRVGVGGLGVNKRTHCVTLTSVVCCIAWQHEPDCGDLKVESCKVEPGSTFKHQISVLRQSLPQGV